MPDPVQITFDGRKVEVAPGTNLVEAGLQAGVPVPVFCYHKDLGAVGSCRVCACTIKGTDGKERTVMACMTAATPGMEVTTHDHASIALRKYVVEWMMLNHPHDCPICDEGGECQLQDLTIACGHSQRRIQRPKRTFENQFLGEFISHEMNRCITCYRCSRFYQEYAGGDDFGAYGSRDRVYFGRFEAGPLESPFSGNLVEMCPTGVFTDKLFRYKSRVWDLEIGHSICPHCSVGCNVHPGSRLREVQRVRVRDNPAVNGVFLCDRGQFGHPYVNAPDRPLQVALNGAPSAWDEALGLAGGELLAIAQREGADKIALIASERASVETHAALAALAQGALAGARVAHFDDPAREARALAALDALAIADCPPLDQGDLAHVDCLLVAGASLVDEAPLAALGARQVARRGGKVFVLAAGERYLDPVATVIPTHPARLAAELRAIAGGLGGNAGNGDPDRNPKAAIAQALGAAKHPAILLGSELMDGPAFQAGAALAQSLKARGTAPRFGCLFPGPNGFGAAMMSQEPALRGILADLQAGKLRAMVVVECAPEAWTPAQLAAFEALALRVTLDYLPGIFHDRATVFLPSEVTYESEGAYVNRAGRVQAFQRSRVPGIPVRREFQGSSFPREYHTAPRLGDVRPAWEALEQLREAAIGAPVARDLTELRAALARAQAVWAPLRARVPGDEGALLGPAAHGRRDAGLAAFEATPGLMAFRVDRTLGSETLSRRAEPVRRMAGAPIARLAPADAERLGVRDAIAVTLGGATFEMAARIHPLVPAGTLLVPRDAAWPPEVPQGVVVQVAAHAMA